MGLLPLFTIILTASFHFPVQEKFPVLVNKLSGLEILKCGSKYELWRAGKDSESE